MPKQRTVLVIDDGSDVTRMLGAELREPEWHLDKAANVEEGITLSRRHPYDVVMISLDSPAPAGIDSLHRIRQVQPTARVLILTSRNNPDNILWAMQEEVFSCFGKPVAADALATMVVRAAAAEGWENGIEVVSAKPEWVSLKLRCRMLTADRVIQFFRELRIDVSDSEREDIGTAFRELLVNAIEHGGKFNPRRTVTVSRYRLRSALLYLIQDPGPGFTFDDLPQSALSNPPDSPTQHMVYRAEHGIRPGGFGILLASQLADELIHSEKGNEVLLVKYLNQ